MSIEAPKIIHPNKTENQLELLKETVVVKSGAFELVRRTWKGWHPELSGAILCFDGENGERVTKQEITLIKPSRFINNNENL